SRKAQLHGYREPFKVRGIEVELHDAGHVIGSAMVAVDGGRVLYTGDFNPHGTITAGRAKPRPCETLIIEATYGRPEQVLPPRGRVLRDLQGWMLAVCANGGGIVGAYTLGKAQEVVAAANAVGLRPMVSDEVSEICDIYVQHNVPLEYDRLDALTPEQRIAPGLLVTSSTATSGRRPDEVVLELRRRGFQTARVSGWCAFAPWALRGVDAGFPMSDHADFTGLIDFVEACAPQQVYTVHGAPRELAQEIQNRLDIPARSLPERGETTLEEFT
ncbi:MAG: MBL fold metallo-hydrolase, partial [Candidatus Thermoplasmatota archaeon]|nr:MBL fold metallo-hydrolase [Candidatus Thermoplasmatota archaeon]